MERRMNLSRRRMLQLTGIGVLGAGTVLAGAGCSSGDAGTAGGSGSEASEGVTLTVYDPTGVVEITQTYAPRLDSLDGKTIAFVGNGMWEEDRTFELIGQLIQEKYPNVTIVGQDNFPRHSDDLTKEDNGIAEKMKELNVDGVIVGNAG